MKRYLSICLAVLPLALVLLLAGCGKKGPPSKKDVSGATVQGRVTFNGQPIKLRPNESLQISFFEDGKPPTDRIQSMGELTDAAATFTIAGPTNKGIPAGKYRVAVSSQIYGGDGQDRFEKTFDVETTPLVVDVGAGEGQTFVIDLGRKSVTKQ